MLICLRRPLQQQQQQQQQLGLADLNRADFNH